MTARQLDRFLVSHLIKEVGKAPRVGNLPPPEDRAQIQDYLAQFPYLPSEILWTIIALHMPQNQEEFDHICRTYPFAQATPPVGTN